MKKAAFYLAGLLVFFTTTSCSDDDSNSSSQNPTQVISTVTSGTWRVTSFIEDGIDHTSDFTNYDFTFAANNVLTADNGSNTVTGFWSVTDDDSNDDSSSSVDFNIMFTSPPDFEEISEDWDIVERTSTKVRLRHVSGGDGSVDTLTFEKN